MPLRVSPAKIACLDFNLQKTKMQMGVQVLVTDPRELEKIRQRFVLLLHTVHYQLSERSHWWNLYWMMNATFVLQRS